MSILTTIDGIPVFDNVLEAENWGISNGVQGTHKHLYLGQAGYMGGSSHSSALNPTATPATPATPVTPVAPITTPVTTPAATTSPSTTPSEPGTQGY